METFMAAYARNLLRAVESTPERYAYRADEVPEVVAKIREAITKNSYVKDSIAFKATCKELKIKNTYAAITSFIANHA